MMSEPLEAVTVSSRCSGCRMTIHSPAWPGSIISTDRAPIFRFVSAPHTGCDGNGMFVRLVPIFTVYEPAPVRRRWWQRR